jgi:hypothetical protein
MPIISSYAQKIIIKKAFATDAIWLIFWRGCFDAQARPGLPIHEAVGETVT